MYIALTQPEFPTLKATLNIKPVIEQEPMKVINRYHKPVSGKVWLAVTLMWIAVLLVAHFVYA
jgi:hypothetical protein